MAYLPKTAFDVMEIRISRPSDRPEATGMAGVFNRVLGAFSSKLNFAYLAMMQLSDGSGHLAGLPPLPLTWGEIKDPHEYGLQVFNWLFAEGSDLRKGFLQARQYAESLERTVPSRGRIRLGLSLDKNGPELHRVRWEAMYDATKSTELALDMPMSRVVREGRPLLWPIIERPLRMCVVISNPRGLEAVGCEPLDVSLEKELINEAVADVSTLVIWRTLAPDPSVGEVASAISEMRPHIVYVLAHAIYGTDGQGSLLFSSGVASPQQLPFSEFASLLVPAHGEAPYLVVLALPQKARVDNINSLALLGQMLVGAGVQAVVAVHAPLPKDQLLRFTEGFFDDLLRTGIVDTAVMAARQSIYKPGEWTWTYPVLYLGSSDAVLFEPFSWS